MTVGADMATVAPTPLALEEHARSALKRQLGLVTSISSPTWRQIVFGGQPIEYTLPRVPDGVLAAIDRLPPGDVPEDATADILHKHLRDTRPQGASLPSISGRGRMAPPRDAQATWLRRVFLLTTGPEALRLLVAGKRLTAPDVTVMESAYPEGLKIERTGAVEAAIALTSAAARNSVSAELPSWLNDQILTLMDEERPTEFFQHIYASEPQPEAKGPSASGGASTIAKQSQPTPSVGENMP